MIVAGKTQICLTKTTILNNRRHLWLEARRLRLCDDALEILGPDGSGPARTVVAVGFGGNFDFEPASDVQGTGMRYAGTRKYFSFSVWRKSGPVH